MHTLSNLSSRRIGKKGLVGFLRVAATIMLLLPVVSGFLVSTCQSSSTGEAYLFISPVAYVADEAGETFQSTVKISNIDDLYSCRLALTYNSSLLDVKEAMEGNLFPPDALQIFANESGGSITVEATLSGSDPPISRNGTIAQFTFEATQAPTACGGSPIQFVDTQLYDSAFEPIDHKSVGALYFWKSLQPDPPAGGFLDLTTQKGGEGLSVPSGSFAIGETVNLTSHVSYNQWPVQRALVAFQVYDPLNRTILMRVTQTDEEGFATTRFRIPKLPESVGPWTAISTVQIDDEVVWDTIAFGAVSPHGPTAIFTWTPEVSPINSSIEFDASSSLPGWNGTHHMPITEYHWNFGDGNTTTTSTPIIHHKFKARGIYYVNLTVYAPGATPETDSTIHKILVIYFPVGGYSIPIQKRRRENPWNSFPDLAATIIVAYAILHHSKTWKRKKNR